MLLLLFACAPVAPERYLAWSADEDGSYAVGPRELPGLTDPWRMSGSLGAVWRGGRLDTDASGATRYEGGWALDLQFSVVDGVGWPMDAQGLLLFSYWGAFSEAVEGMDGAGLGMSALLPLDAAWVPSTPSILLEILPAENAAYATGGHTLVLLPEGVEDGVPLAANRAVLSHELGHAIFHFLTVGDPLAPPVFAQDGGEGDLVQRCIHEGFADIVASQVWEDPGFIEASVDMPERRVDGDSTLAEVVTPEEWLAEEHEALDLFDPYALGTVFASFAWDLHEAGIEGRRVLELATSGAVSWADLVQGAGSFPGEGRLGFIEGMLEAADPEEREVGCAAAAFRFPDQELMACQD